MTDEVKETLKFHKEWESTKVFKLFDKNDKENIEKYVINTYMAKKFHFLRKYIDELYDPNCLIFSEDSWTVPQDGWYCGVIMKAEIYYKNDKEHVFLQIALDSGFMLNTRFCMYDANDSIFSYLRKKYNSLSLRDLLSTFVWIEFKNYYRNDEVTFSKITDFFMIPKDEVDVYIRISDLMLNIEEKEKSKN